MFGKYTKTCDCKNHRKVYHIDNILVFILKINFFWFPLYLLPLRKIYNSSEDKIDNPNKSEQMQIYISIYKYVYMNNYHYSLTIQ